MVELKLESLDIDNLPKDIFLSVRVGEAQKLSRVAAEKTYKFPASICNTRRFGKVEVFRRVGGTPVDIRPEDGIVQEIELPCGVNDDKLRFRVSLAGQGESADPKKADNIPVDVPEQPEKPEKPQNPKVLEAREYLLQHNLEMRLSEAMQTVLRDRPEDPAAYIGEKLAQSAGAVRKVKSSQGNREDSEQTKPGDADDLKSSQGNREDSEQAKPGNVDDLKPSQDYHENSEHSKPGNEDDLREQAKQALLNASSNGQLERTLTEMSLKKSQPEDSSEFLREQARLTLLAASDDGQLERTLTEMSLQKKQEVDSSDSLREQARLTLLSASGDGRLDTALSDLQVERGVSSEEALKEQATQTLLKASSDGRLSAALEECRNMKSEAPESVNPANKSLVDMREEAKNTLLLASNDGRLASALSSMKGPATNVQTASAESIRLQAKESLLNASGDGRLTAALGDLQRSKTDTATDEDLRDQAKSTLLSASQNGSLAAALAAAKQESPQPDPADLRRQAKLTLLEAFTSGHLDEALQNLRTQNTCSGIPAHETSKDAEETQSVLSVLPNQAMYGPIFYSCNLTPNLRIF